MSWEEKLFFFVHFTDFFFLSFLYKTSTDTKNMKKRMIITEAKPQLKFIQFAIEQFFLFSNEFIQMVENFITHVYLVSPHFNLFFFSCFFKLEYQKLFSRENCGSLWWKFYFVQLFCWLFLLLVLDLLKQGFSLFIILYNESMQQMSLIYLLLLVLFWWYYGWFYRFK